MLVALDLGSSSVRAVAVDEDGAPVALARRKVTLHAGPDGSGTLDPDDYLAGLVACLDELHPRLSGVHTVAASAQWHSIIGLDRSGAPVTAAVTWADTRPGEQPGSAPTDPEAFHQRTGSWYHGLYWTVRLPWLRRLAPTATRFTGLPDYVLGSLLGERTTSVSLASGTGLLDTAAMCWDEEALSLAGTHPSTLDPLAPAGWAGRLSTRYARRWPALAEARWAPPTGDGAASNVGAGCWDERHVAVTVGTSAAVRVVQRVTGALPRLAPGVWRYRVDHDRVVTGFASSAGGNVHAWAVRNLRLPDPQPSPTLVPGSHGLTVVPLLAGTRPPEQIPAGSGLLSGLSFASTAEHVLAALLEGVCFELAHGLAQVEQALPAPATPVLCGGAVAASPWWCRALAAAFGRPVEIVSDPETGIRGAAALALGRVGSRPAWTRLEPSAQDIASMTAAAERYTRLRADA
ncbi:MAG TPA: FGGY family carbohydrate kinase [Micromonosporaceae bacterium]